MIARLWKLASSVAMLVLVGTLAACQDDAHETPAPPSVPAGHTTPGTTLQFGEPAVIKRADGDAVLSVTVQSIVPGMPSDIARYAEGLTKFMVPYYVHYHVELISGDAQGVNMMRYFYAEADGEFATPFLLPLAANPGRFPKCTLAYLPRNEPGAEYDSCRIFLTDDGAPRVDRVFLRNGEAYEGDTAISWDAEG